MDLVSFKDQQLYLGIDVHKRQWTVTVMSESLSLKTFSQPSKPEALKSFLDHQYPGALIKCAYESCKIGYWIYRTLCSYGYDCLVVNAADIPSTNKESAEKTDTNDSKKIAKALRAGLLRGIYIPSVEYEGYRQLFRYRKKLWSDLVRVKNRIRDKLLCQGIRPPEGLEDRYWSKKYVRWLWEVELPSQCMRLTLDRLLDQYELVRMHLLKVNGELRKVARHSALQPTATLLRSIPGIGPLTTAQLMSEIVDIDRFESFKKFNGYIGLKPTSHSSGDRDLRGRLTYRSHSSLRSTLIECAWVSIRKDPALSLCYEQLTQRMTGKRAIVKIARKLLSRIYHVLKHREPYVLSVVK